MMPIEWLRGLVEREAGYEELVERSGSLSVAAHRVASARCQTWSTPTVVPTGAELRAAALEIVRRVDLPTSVPTVQALRSDCEARGLLVL
ncbi:MAG: hypothetical protein AAGF12_04015 [Myxococcota bacterium]